MFYHLLFPLKEFFSPLNVISYITFRSIAAIITSLFITFFLGKFIITSLKKMQIIQIIRTDGPSTHHAKAGTPTMGGVLILISLVISTFLWARLDNPYIIWSIVCVLWLGFIGIVDDYLKIIKKNPKGIPPAWKLAGQIVFAFIISVYLYLWPQNSSYATAVNVPYLKDTYLELAGFYIIFAIIVIVGSSNAVNLTDGLDGLAIGNITISAFTYAIFAYLAGHSRFSH
ncbi:MAG: phospho-N-acetylmuramoyl-pentapeptide-transferase, partial [Elusimicrobiota bacterium]